MPCNTLFNIKQTPSSKTSSFFCLWCNEVGRQIPKTQWYVTYASASYSVTTLLINNCKLVKVSHEDAGKSLMSRSIPHRQSNHREGFINIEKCLANLHADELARK